MNAPGNRISLKRRAFFVVCGATLLLAPAAFAADPAPSASPSNDDLAQLVQQLGADDFSLRESAASRLQQAGPAAKGALEQAAKSDSPEIRLRAADILRRLTTQTLPGLAPDNAPVDLPDSVTVSPDGQSVTVTSGGRTTQIDQDAAGIHMTVTGFVDGKPAFIRFDAPDADALHTQAPNAFALWQQYHPVNGQVIVQQSNGVIIAVRGGTVLLNGGIPLQITDDADDFSKLTTTEIAKMKEKNYTDQQTSKVLEQIQRVRLAKESVQINGNGVDPASGQAAFLQASDDLRKQLNDAGLADPGTLLPPPPSSRLGVSVGGDLMNPGGGVPVNTVGPDSRAQRLGLAPGDVIRAMNGKPVATTTDLRQAVMSNRTLTISIVRDGKELTLQESSPKTQPSP